MGELQELLDDELFKIAPQQKQAAILDTFFKTRISNAPGVTEVPADVLEKTRQDFILKNLPEPRSTLLGGPEASLRPGKPSVTIGPEEPTPDRPIIRAPLPGENEGQIVQGPTPLPQMVKEAAKKVLMAPVALAAAPAIMANEEGKALTRRGMILEGMGRPRSNLETAAEVALRGALLGGVVDRSDLPRTLKGTLLDILELGGTVAGVGELASAAKGLKAARVVDNIITAAPKMGLPAEEIALLNQVKTKLADVVQPLARGAKSIPYTPASRLIVPGEEVAGQAPKLILPGETTGKAPRMILPGESATPETFGDFNLEGISDLTIRGIMNEAMQIPAVARQAFAAKRGVLPDAVVRGLAEKVDLTPEKLREVAPGTVFNAEGIAKAKSLLDGIDVSMEHLVQKFAAAKESGDAAAIGAAVGDFQKLFKPVVDVMVKFGAIKSELGRAFRQIQVPAGKLSSIRNSVFKDALAGDQLLTPENAEQMLERMLKSGNPNFVQQMVQEIKPTFMDKLVTLLTAAKLSNPVTFIRNATGNTLAMLTALSEKTAAGPIDLLRSALTGTPRERYAGEAGAYAYGAASGVDSAASEFLKAFKDSHLGDRMTEVFEKGPAFTGKTGKVVNFPFKVLTGTDNFFKSLLSNAELRSQAFRQAVKEGKVGAARWERIDELVANPPKEWLTGIEKHVKDFTFQGDLGPLAKWADRGRSLGGGVGKLFVPFFKTPVNIAKFITQRTPLGFAAPRNVRAFIQGGGSAVDAAARIIPGSMLSLYFFKKALEGKITGAGPNYKNKAERDLLYQQGWQPRSILLNGRYYSYSGFEPLATPLGMAADAAEAYYKRKEVPTMETVSNMAWSLMENITDQPYLQGVNDMVDALQNEQKAYKYAQSFASGLVPTGLGLAARLTDPIVRKPEGIIQSMAARVPGLSTMVPPRRNVFGEPVVREGAFPIATSDVKDTELTRELARINKSVGHLVGFRGNRINGRKLNQQEYQQFQEQAGPVIKEKIVDLISSERYQKLTDPAKKRALKAIENKVAEDVADHLSVDVELRSLGLPTLGKMELDPELAEVLRKRLKTRIDTRAFRDKPDPKRVEAINEKIADVLQNY